MSAPFRTIDVASPYIQALQVLIQLELANRGYSTHDDPVMAEYIVVMLANQKTSEQVTSELEELVGDEYDENFTQWVWDQTENALQQAGVGNGEASTSSGRNVRRRSRSPIASGSTGDQRRERRSISPDARRRGAEDRRRSRSPLSRRGERLARDYSSDKAWRASMTPRRNGGNEDFVGAQHWRNKAEERRRNPPPPVAQSRLVTNALHKTMNKGGSNLKNVNEGKELFRDSTNTTNNTDETLPSYAESGGVSIFGRAGIPDPRAPAFVPSNSAPSAPEDAPQQNGTSIFARIDPMLPSNPPPSTASTSETVHDSNFPTEPSESSVCRWNLGCTNPMCPYSHASPANAGPGGDPNALVLNGQNCRFGAKCINKDCTRGHVSPAVTRLTARSNPTSTSFPNFKPANPPTAEAKLSMDAALPSNPTSRPCRFGAACTRADCFFSHPPNRGVGASAGAGSGTPCRFGLGCTRADCYYSHPPGVRASANGNQGTAHRL